MSDRILRKRKLSSPLITTHEGREPDLKKPRSETRNEPTKRSQTEMERRRKINEYVSLFAKITRCPPRSQKIDILKRTHEVLLQLKDRVLLLENRVAATVQPEQEHIIKENVPPELKDFLYQEHKTPSPSTPAQRRSQTPLSIDFDEDEEELEMIREACMLGSSPSLYPQEVYSSPSSASSSSMFTSPSITPVTKSNLPSPFLLPSSLASSIQNAEFNNIETSLFSLRDQNPKLIINPENISVNLQTLERHFEMQLQHHQQPASQCLLEQQQWQFQLLPLHQVVEVAWKPVIIFDEDSQEQIQPTETPSVEDVESQANTPLHFGSIPSSTSFDCFPSLQNTDNENLFAQAF